MAFYETIAPFVSASVCEEKKGETGKVSPALSSFRACFLARAWNHLDIENSFGSENPMKIPSFQKTPVFPFKHFFEDKLWPSSSNDHFSIPVSIGDFIQNKIIVKDLKALAPTFLAFVFGVRAWIERGNEGAPLRVPRKMRSLSVFAELQ
jgi:hypothetical protein